MNLIIGNLPSQATESDLGRLLRLPKADQARRLRIFKKTAPNGQTRRFGLVYIPSAGDLRKLKARAQGAELHGHRLSVREFLPRAVANERRALNWRQVEWRYPERRARERRAAAR